jgi:hypothetical protein
MLILVVVTVTSRALLLLAESGLCIRGGGRRKAKTFRREVGRVLRSGERARGGGGGGRIVGFVGVAAPEGRAEAPRAEVEA